jgi:hypothetical protein
MKKFIVLVAAVVLAACGSESNSQSGGGSNPAGPGGGTITTAAVSPLSTTVKVVLNTIQYTETKVCDYDDVTERCLDVTCPTAPAACADSWPGSICATTAAFAGLCVTSANVPTIVYVKNFVGTVPAQIPVPCVENQPYNAEIFATQDPTAQSIYNVYEGSRSANFTMTPGTGGTCAPVDGNPSWTDVAFPSFVFPSVIYAGLAAPWDRFVVTIEGLVHPWSASGWTLDYDHAAAPLPLNPITPSFAGSRATLPAPGSTNGSNLTFTGVFRLDSKLLLTGEHPWQRVVTQTTTAAPIGSGGVGLPP